MSPTNENVMPAGDEVMRAATDALHCGKPKLLATYACNPEWRVRRAVATNPSTDVETVRRLCRDAQDDVRLQVAKHPNADVCVLAFLADDANEYVRVVVAENPNTSVPTLERLAADRFGAVAISVLKNPNTPEHVIELLAANSNRHVAVAAQSELYTISEQRGAGAEKRAGSWRDEVKMALSTTIDSLKGDKLTSEGLVALIDVITKCAKAADQSNDGQKEIVRTDVRTSVRTT